MQCCIHCGQRWGTAHCSAQAVTFAWHTESQHCGGRPSTMQGELSLLWPESTNCSTPQLSDCSHCPHPVLPVPEPSVLL